MRTAKVLLASAMTVMAAAQKPATFIAVVSGQDVHVSGDMTLVNDGMAAASGARVNAAKHNALLKLTRGGEVALCQSSAMTLDARGSQLWLALQSGTIEARYPLSAGADTLLTPDYRISIISGSGMPGDEANFRVGIGAKGDLLVQVLPTSQSYLVIASNFETSQAVVRPGETRGFTAVGSSATALQVAETVSLRCPVEQTPQTQTMTASVGTEQTPPNTLNIPLAYRAPEMPDGNPTETASTASAAPATTAADELKVARESPAQGAPPSSPEASPTPPPSPSPSAPVPVNTVASQIAPPTPKPAIKAKTNGNAFVRLFHFLFGSKNNAKTES
jgi:hypothetical protein